MKDERTGDERKIVVDDDWKQKVQAEKEAAAKAPPIKPAAEKPMAEKHAKESAATAADESAGAMPLPDASFPMLVSSLAAQAMVAMGKLADPVQGHPVVRPDMAKHFIDLLGMLQEKTRGNLSPQESGMLDNFLHELRMMFVSIRLEATKEK